MIDGFDQCVVHFQELVDGLPALVASVGAMGTTPAGPVLLIVDPVAQFVAQPFAFVRREHVRLRAVVADDADEALRQHHLDRQRHHVTRHTHVEQTDRRR